MAIQGGLDDARMNGVGGDVGRLIAMVELISEDDVGPFALPIPLPVVVVSGVGHGEIGVVNEGLKLMASTSQSDDADRGGLCGLLQDGEKELSEIEVTHVIGPQLHFNAILCRGEGAGHDARVEDEQVEGVIRCNELLGEALNVGQRAEVQVHGDERAPHSCGRGVLKEGLDGGVVLLSVAGCEDDLSSSRGEDAGGLQANARAGAGDENRLVAKVGGGRVVRRGQRGSTVTHGR